METVKLRWWLTVILCLGTVAAAQFFSGNQVKTQTEELQNRLDKAYSLSLGLTRSLGYGGLIHNLKNQILRPGDQSYTINALENAHQALRQIEGLEVLAHEVGVSTTLDATRTMIAAYSERLSEMKAMVTVGYNPIEIDAQIQFDDHDAIYEIDALLRDLRFNVSRQIRAVSQQDSALHWMSSAATVFLFVALLLQQSKRLRDLSSIKTLNGKLSESVKDLGEANAALKQFASIVSHDLKAPLRHIGFYGTLIKDDIENVEVVTEHIGSISQSVARMDRMIESLLEFTRTGFTEPKLSNVEIEQIAGAALKELEPGILAKSAEVSVDLTGSVSADPDLVGRVFENLIGNSLKYSRDDIAPRIELKSWRVDDWLNVAISDNGIGIDPQYAERVFEPFQRLHDSSEQYEGTGIGLSLVKTVLEVHNGDVWIDPDYVDGTRIVLRLKAVEATAKVKPELELA